MHIKIWKYFGVGLFNWWDWAVLYGRNRGEYPITLALGKLVIYIGRSSVLGRRYHD